MSDAAAPVVADRPPPRVWIARLVWVAALLALDLWSKSAVFAWLTGQPELLEPDRHGHARLPLVGDWLAFMLSLNPGMAWSMDFLPAPLLVLGRGLAVLFLGWLLVRCERGRPLLLTALLLILAGALGNLCDNLLLAPDLSALEFGKVRDFIDVYFAVWDWHFPTFNVADSCISVGAVFLVLSSLRRAPEPAGGSA